MLLQNPTFDQRKIQHLLNILLESPTISFAGKSNIWPTFCCKNIKKTHAGRQAGRHDHDLIYIRQPRGGAPKTLEQKLERTSAQVTSQQGHPRHSKNIEKRIAKWHHNRATLNPKTLKKKSKCTHDITTRPPKTLQKRTLEQASKHLKKENGRARKKK